MNDSSLLARLKTGLSKTSAALGEGIAGVFTRRTLDAGSLSGLEELLIQADIGAATAAKIVADFGRHRLNKDITAEEVKKTLAEEIAKILAPVERPLVINTSHKPHVVLVVGVNGNGKTTTIGKLAHHFKGQGHSVMLAAVDTFRAAAVEQLKVWAERTGCECISGEANADPASVAYRAIEAARAKKTDILLIDSAGRLQNKTGLMEELQKTIRVMQKIDTGAPHSVVQILDATTGQNALSQVEVFSKMVHVSGLIVTKLDGTAKGGIMVGLAARYALPVYMVGLGEGMADLRPFSAIDFAYGLTGASH